MRKYLGRNVKTEVEREMSYVREEILENVKNIYKKLRVNIGEGVMKEISNVKGMVCEDKERFLCSELDEVLEKLSGLAIYELDKNNGCMGVMCGGMYRKKMFENFDEKMKQYELVNLSEKEIMENVKREFDVMGLGKRFKGKRKCG